MSLSGGGGSSKASQFQSVTEYRMSIHYGICAGPVDSLHGVWVGEKQIFDTIYSNPTIINIYKPDLYGGTKKEGGIGGAIHFLDGSRTQLLSNLLAGKFGRDPYDCPAFRGTCTLFCTEPSSDTSGSINAVSTIGSPDPASPQGLKGFYWTANSPYLRGIWAKVSRVPRHWYSSKAAIPHGTRTTRAIWIAFDVSLSMSGTRFTILKESLHSVIDQIQGAISTGTKIHLGMTAWGGGRSSISFLNTTLDNLDTLRAWVDSRSLMSSTNFEQGVIDAVAWFKTFSVPLEVMVFITDGEPNFVSSATAAADRLAEVPNVDVYGINIELTNTTYTEMVDNTPTDGVPVVSGTSQSGLTNAIAKALFPDPLSPDANPAHIIHECLTNTEWGMGAPLAHIDADAFIRAADYLYGEQFGLSMKWTRQSSIEDFISEVLDHIEGVLYLDPTVGKLKLVLIRDDYVEAEVPILDATNCTVSDFQTKPPAEIINEVIVTYTDARNEEERSYTLQDLGSIAAQGAVISDSRNYYGVRYYELARRLAQRDLRTAGSPLASCQVEVDRTVPGIVPGGVVKLVWPEYGVGEMFMRVGPVNYGRPGQPTIRASLVQDVFSKPKPEWDDETEEGSLWVDPSEQPAAAAHVEFFTLPYYAAELVADGPVYPAAYTGALVSQTGQDTSDYQLYGPTTNAGGTVVLTNLGTKDLTARATLANVLGAEVQSAVSTFNDFTLGGGPMVGGFMMIGDDPATAELAYILSVTAPNYDIRRGLLDTVPKSWPAGTPVWFFNMNSRMYDPVARIAGESLTYYVCPRTSLGVLPLGSAPPIVHVADDRLARPLRPANVKINNDPWGEVDLRLATDATITWSNRNRFTETAQVLSWDGANVTPEVGQTTKIQVLDIATRAVLNEVTGITGTSHAVPTADMGAGGKVIIRVTAERAGLESYQAHEITVILRSGYGYSYGYNYGN